MGMRNTRGEINKALYGPGRKPEHDEGDVALKQTRTGSYVKLDGKGDIRLTTRTGAFLLLERERGSIRLQGKFINLSGEAINLRTRPDGLRWNGWQLNPELYSWNATTLPSGVALSDLRLDATVLRDGVRTSVRIPIFLAVEDDTELDDLLAASGIYDPTEG